jgi:hypothetical protein
MCHHVHVKLTPAEEKAVRKMYGIMVPVFASVILVLVAAIAFTQPPRGSDKLLTADAASAASLADAIR